MKMNLPSQPSDCFDLELPAGKRFDMVGFGQNTVDDICVVPGFPRRDSKTEVIRYERQAGGQVATAVAFAARLGLSAKYIGKVGSDENGRLSAASLAEERIDISSVVVSEGARNHHSFILVDASTGERTILWERDSRLDYHTGELQREAICAGKILLLDASDPEAALQAARWAREDGIPVVVDFDKVIPTSGELLPLVDFLIVSSDFPQEFTGLKSPTASLLALRNHCEGFLAVTLGAQGALALVGGRCVPFPGYAVHAVDTTGAGDIFHGAFLYGLSQNWPLDRMITFANAAAALNCTRLGARSGMPEMDEILNVMNQH